jgi:hypothetical protein
LELKGHVKVWKNGRLIAEGHNLVVTAGKTLLAQLIGQVGSTAPSHMACGNNGSATTAGMTALQGTEHTRVALTSTVVASNVVTYSASFSVGSPISIREFGIFNALVGGTMLTRFICNDFTIDSGDGLAVSWAITIGA